MIQKAVGFSATDAFRDIYRLAELRLRVGPVIDAADILCVPSIPRFVSVGDIQRDPIGPNSELGTYTNFVNLLDMCGLAVPTAPRRDGRPGSVTLLAAKGRDNLLASIGGALHRASARTLGATGQSVPPMQSGLLRAIDEDEIELAVVGAHMSGLPLNGELTRLGARFVRKAFTAPLYRLFALAGGPPARPGLIRSHDGAAIAIETWAVPKSRFGEFIAGVPQPLGIGTLTLETGEQVKGFLCEAAGLEGAVDVTEYGGWRGYLFRNAA